jgi:RimJ/RimL family protein N-acetyltransferase
MLQAEAEGKGYAHEAATVARDWVWANLAWPSMVSYIDAGNTRSTRLAERLSAALDEAAEQPAGDDCLVYRHPTPETHQ